MVIMLSGEAEQLFQLIHRETSVCQLFSSGRFWRRLRLRAALDLCDLFSGERDDGLLASDDVDFNAFHDQPS